MTAIATTTDLQTAIRARDRAEIIRLAERLLEQRTRLDEQWFGVAHVLVRTGEVALAVSAAERGVEECGASGSARFQLAHVLSIVGRQDDAIPLVSAIPPGQLNSVQRDHFLGTCALETGNFELGRTAFEAVLKSWLGSGATWLSLAALPPEDDGVLLERLNAARPTIMATAADSIARWHYAKGTVLDRLGRTGEAFAEFASGAGLVKAARTYDPDADRREAAMLATEFTSDAVSGFAGQVATDTSRAVLVTGLPRSGTTLVEQILTSHSTMSGGGEMPFGSILTREVGGNSLSQLESFAAEHGVDELARLYLHLGDERFGQGRRFVDKGLGASRDLGILASVLPEAPIIWLRRDPLDCAWSCFRTYFSGGIEWSWSLADIAQHFGAEDHLFDHWRGVLGKRMLVLSYEELVADPETQIGAILDHVGLDSEPAMAATHLTQRAVTTASVTQVRQPVYETSVGAAKPYRDHLKPFVDAYRADAPQPA
jgi:hypothetical protein